MAKRFKLTFNDDFKERMAARIRDYGRDCDTIGAHKLEDLPEETARHLTDEILGEIEAWEFGTPPPEERVAIFIDPSMARA